MNLLLARFGDKIDIIATEMALTLKSTESVNWNWPESWPADAIEKAGGKRASFEVASLLEMGLAELAHDNVEIPYSMFPLIEREEISLPISFTAASPFLLHIDRSGDLGRPDFHYKYQFLLAGTPVPLRRMGYYVNRLATDETFHLDAELYSLLDAMDSFNSLPAQEKTPQTSWLAFSKIKQWASLANTTLEGVLRHNNVIIPSSIGLDLFEETDGSLSFVPTCPELDDKQFRTVFERNNSAEGFYSLDLPGLEKVRVVLTDRQKQVLTRMKRVRHVTGETKRELMTDPRPIFDGVVGDVDLPYGDRVLGIGEFEYVSVPTPFSEKGPMGDLFGPSLSTVRSEPPTSEEQEKDVEPTLKKSLLIDTHEEFVRKSYVDESTDASIGGSSAPFERPKALRSDFELKAHQTEGIHWLQICARINNRKGVLLADEMGVGKTLQILSFLAWCLESSNFPDLSRHAPPFRPILIVAPLILLETETWQREMGKFFSDAGNVFWPVLPLYGKELLAFRRKDAEGRESLIAKPILDIDRIRKHRVVITNYEAIRDYEFSFAYFPDGVSLWSVVITDEAHEFKTPNSKISHAMKALRPDFRIACTGTPVENRLLDLWNLFDTVQPGLLGSAKEFSAKFESNLEDNRAESSSHDLRSRLLYQKPHAFLMRRLKSEVLDLPKKHEHKVRCIMSPDEVEKHRALTDGMGLAKQTKGKLDVLHKFARLYQHPLLSNGSVDDSPVEELKEHSSKLRAVLDILHQVRANEEKAIIFARHKEIQRMLARVLSTEFQKPVRIINGDTPRAPSLRKAGVETRKKILDQFSRTQGFDVVVLSPFVAGVGLTIVEANHVIHYGRWWNPAVEAQATDRVYRIGQEKEVHVYLPILEDSSGQISQTFDQLLDRLMETKKELAAGTLRKDDFMRPHESEDGVGLEVFANLEKSTTSPDGRVDA